MAVSYLEQEKIKVAMEREHMLNSMLRSISHDLRTPLTGIVGASQLMMNQDHLTNEDIYSLAKDIHDQAHWLTQIVENILNMSKIESGNLVLHKNLEVVDDLIYEAIQHLPELEKRNVVVDVPQDLLFINVDGKLMVQVFINILNNAIKYTKEKDQITIHVKKLEDEVQFMIKDTGSGISKNILDNLQKNWSNYEIIGLDINNADHKNKIKKLKSHFASELIPFLGVFDDKETLMGFYSEKTHKYEQTQKCSWDQINTWLKTYYENNTTIL